MFVILDVIKDYCITAQGEMAARTMLYGDLCTGDELNEEIGCLFEDAGCCVVEILILHTKYLLRMT